MNKKLTFDNYRTDLAKQQEDDMWELINTYIDNFERPSKFTELHYSTINIAITIRQTKKFVIVKIVN